jgi:hypothetical protein
MVPTVRAVFLYPRQRRIFCDIVNHAWLLLKEGKRESFVSDGAPYVDECTSEHIDRHSH